MADLHFKCLCKLGQFKARVLICPAAAAAAAVHVAENFIVTAVLHMSGNSLIIECPAVLLLLLLKNGGGGS